MKKDCAVRRPRLARFQETLRREKRGAVIVAERESVYYLSGFRGSSGWLLVTPRRAFLLTDFRYREQAEEEVVGGIRIVADYADPVQGAVAVCRQSRWQILEVEEAGFGFGDFRRLKSALKGCRLQPCPALAEQQRMVKEGGELHFLREAARRTVRVWDKLVPLLKKGMTELKVAELLLGLIREAGGRESFEPIVAAGAHSSHPHARPSSRLLKSGMALMVDFGLEWKGYHSDLTRTLALGRYPPRFKEIYRVLLDTQSTVLAAVRPGMPARKLDLLAREKLGQHGLDAFFGHSLGHGVGLAVHELPRINRSCRETLAAGMVFTVEPGVYLPGWGGIRIEDTVLVTARGRSILTMAPKELDSALLKW